MKSALFSILAYGQVLTAAQSPVDEGRDYYYETSYSKNFIKSDLQKEKGDLKWVGKTCAVATVSIATFALFTIQACFTPSSPYKPFVAAGVAGAATYAYFELSGDSE